MRVFTFSLALFGLLSMVEIASAQTTGEEYYVTIGVFSMEKNAIHVAAKANEVGFYSQYAVNPNKRLTYVYLFQSNDKRKAYAFLIKLKAETKYKDAWIFTGLLGNDKGQIAEVVPSSNPVVKTPVKQPPIVTPTPTRVDSSSKVSAVPKKAKGKFFIFKFINQETENEVRGEVHLAESKTATQYQAFKANELVDIPAPRNVAGSYYVSTIAPGYRALETNISYKDTLSSSGTGPNGELIIPFTLERAKRGDYIEFNDVGFYRNSVVLLAKAEDELNGLADLMKENKNYKVKVHAHCNGDGSRDIITLGTSTKFFENDPGNVKKTGSAKELTELRAESVRRFLVSQGIDVDRILTKGEGGKEMIYPQNSVYANYNDRVEIEVIKH